MAGLHLGCKIPCAMPSDRSDLDQRLAAATAKDTVRGVAFDGLFGVVREHASASAAIAVDPLRKGRRTPFFSYPVADFLRIAWDAADVLETRGLAFAESLFQFGHAAAASVFASALGRTLSAIADMDPARLLAHTSAGYKAVVSYGDRKVELISHGHARIAFRHDFLVPSYHCGVFVGAVEAVGGKDVKARGVQNGLLEATYEITWDV
jgi:uncharacterized protein (TIGR02265 family)